MTRKLEKLAIKPESSLQYHETTKCRLSLQLAKFSIYVHRNHRCGSIPPTVSTRYIVPNRLARPKVCEILLILIDIRVSRYI